MFECRSRFGHALRRCAVIALCAWLAVPAPTHAAAPQVEKPSATTPVTITETDRAWRLDNGIVSATINKRNATIETLVYKGTDTMGHDQGRGANWEQDPGGAPTIKPTITIDPAGNGGERGEVSVAGFTSGTVMLSPNAAGGGTQCNLEIRYTLGRGESGLYTYAIFSHPPTYGAMGIGESRFIVKLNQSFDWLSVDADRHMLACAPADWGSGVAVHAKEQRILSQGLYKNSVEHKYSYTAVMSKIPAYGWSSTQKHVGVWFINPSQEYLGGGASKQELVCHFGDSDNPDPIILDYWRGTHYAGGASCSIDAGEAWSKVIGPIYIYCNALSAAETATPTDLATLKATAGNPTVPQAWQNNATALWHDALAQAKQEATHWPYPWVRGVDYPQAEQRAAVTGQIVLNDPQAASKTLPNLTVGLTHADYARGQGGGRGRRRGFGGATGATTLSTATLRRFGISRTVDWAHDAKFYQFWAAGSPDGQFSIPKVRPGVYTLHAFADGVLGEFAKTTITIAAGQTLDLGKLPWTPLRHGRQLWEIGIPDRTGGEFLKGDGPNYWLWGWGLRYPLLFPDDVTYTVGKSDFRKDWLFQQTPRGESTAWLNPAAKEPAHQRFGWVKAESLKEYPDADGEGPWRKYGNGDACTWFIRFDMPSAAKGQAYLRIALAGADGNGGLAIDVNGKHVGTLNPVATNALRYNTNKSVWYEYTQPFDAALLKPGPNQLNLTIPAGDLTTGVVYDYLRLELDEQP